MVSSNETQATHIQLYRTTLQEPGLSISYTTTDWKSWGHLTALEPLVLHVRQSSTDTVVSDVDFSSENINRTLRSHAVSLCTLFC